MGRWDDVNLVPAIARSEVYFDFVITDGFGLRVPHVAVEVRIRVTIGDGNLARQALCDPVVGQNSSSIHDAIVQHQLANRSFVSCGDRKIALAGGPVNGNVSPDIFLNSQGVK